MEKPLQIVLNIMDERENPYNFLPVNHRLASSKIYSKKCIAIRVSNDIISTLKSKIHTFYSCSSGKFHRLWCRMSYWRSLNSQCGPDLLVLLVLSQCQIHYVLNPNI